MDKYNNYKTYLGSFLLGLIMLVNIWIAAGYYNLSRKKLPQFFIWQINVEKGANK